MKTLATIFMALVILIGLALALTPFVADKFFPIPENTVRQAKPEAAARALRQWFGAPDAPFIDVQAIQKESNGKRTAWFAFSVGRQPVEHYIVSKKLQQLELSDKVYDDVFYASQAPASWWQPRALAQQTYFSGKDQGRNVSLIYNPNSKRGILLTTTAPQP
jgi:hypothetical protein